MCVRLPRFGNLARVRRGDSAVVLLCIPAFSGKVSGSETVVLDTNPSNTLKT